MTGPLREHGDGCELDVLVAPRAARSQVVGLHDGRLKIQLAAPPVDGAANAALCELLADVLEVPKSAVTIARGQTGKRKTVRLAGLAAAAARARLGLGLALASLAACTTEIPFPVHVILPEESAELDKADNLALVVAPNGFTASYKVKGIDFSVEVEVEPDSQPRTLALYLADGTALLGWGRSAPFVLISPPSDLAVLVGRPGALSTYPGTAAEPDTELMAARAPGLGLAFLSGSGDIALLNEFNFQVESGARLDPDEGLPAATDGVLVPDPEGDVWRIAWATDLRAYVWNPGLDVWTTSEIVGDPAGSTPTNLGPAAAAASGTRDRLWIAGGDADPALFALSLVLDDDDRATVTRLAALDGPRHGAAVVPVTRGDDESPLVVGGDADLPAVYVPAAGLALGPAGPWTGLQCQQLDPADAASVRVVCLGGLRGGQPTTDALLLNCPANTAETTVEERPNFLTTAVADPRLFADDLAVYAQGSATWQRIDRGDLTVTATPSPATREAGGHSITIGTGVTFLVGGKDASDRPVDRWWIFAPALPST